MKKNVGEADYVNVGGIFGMCEGLYAECNIENCINMGSVKLSAITKAGTPDNINGRVGGIAGLVCAYMFPCTVKNCINYGFVTFSGEVDYSSISGVIGSIAGRSYPLNYGRLQNCLNYGTLIHSGVSRFAASIGGVAGGNSYGIEVIDNIANFGFITVNKQSTPRQDRIGALVGYLWKITLTHSYWVDNTKYEPCGFINSAAISECANFSSTTLTLDKSVSVGKYSGRSLIDALNAGADLDPERNYAHWLLNKDSKAVSFRVNNDRTIFKANSQLILMPDLANEGTTILFDGWFTDEACTTKLTNFEVKANTVLYGKWGNSA